MIIKKIPNPKVTNPPPITACIHGVEKGFKRHVLETEYHKCLYNYNSLHSLPLDNVQFFSQYPYATFFTQHNCLYRAYNPFLDFSLPTKQLFEELHQPCSTDATLESKLIYALKNLVKYSSQVSLPVQKATVYLSENLNMATYYNQLINSSIQIDGNLYCRNSYGTFSFFNPNELLWAEKYYNENKLRLFNLPSNYSDIRKNLTPAFFDLIKSNIKEKLQYKSSQIPYYLAITVNGNLNKYNLCYYDKKSHTFKISSFKEEFQVGNDILANHNSLVLTYPSFFTHAYNHAINTKPRCTTAIAEFLYTITNGNLSSLDTLAKLYACMACPENLNTSFMVLYNPEQLSQAVLENILFTSFTNNNYYDPICQNVVSLKYITSNQNIPELISYQLRFIRAFTIADCHSLSNSDKNSIVKKIISGKPLTYYTKNIGKVTLTNTLPLIFYPKTELEIKNLSSTLEPLKLNLVHLKDNMFGQYHTSSICDREWLNINFVLYGLSLIATNDKSSLNSHTDSPTPVVSNSDSFFTEFINYCCDITGDKNDYIFNTTLYDKYHQYVLSTYHINSHEQKSFIAQINKLDTVIPRKKHRDSSGHVLQCTQGIRFKENVNIPIKDSSITEEKDCMSKWFELLSTIDDFVPDDFNN